ncbi:MAG: ion transporter [Nitrospira sp.]|nr:ion transporter [Nitrospira sp.]
MSGKFEPYTASVWRSSIYTIIFEADTRAGKAFDILLFLSIIASVIVVMLDSVKDIHNVYGEELYIAEWFFTFLFSAEYLIRILSLKRPMKYVGSFFGIVDMLAILPTYLSIILPGSQYLIAIRILRILRIFRVLKLVQYISESQQLMSALWASRRKIAVFLFTVLTMIVIFGSLMYLVEGEENGFSSIPKSIYWAVVTLTTVGYGDIAPKTNLGQILASLIMITGYSIIAVPTGIISAEIARAAKNMAKLATCPQCGCAEHASDAKYCKDCASSI